MAENNIEGLERYMIIIHGPPRGEHKGYYDTDEFGSGTVSVYEILEGSTPGSRFSVGHIRRAGGFVLQGNHHKTLAEFMQEVRDGLSKIISGEH